MISADVAGVKAGVQDAAQANSPETPRGAAARRHHVRPGCGVQHAAAASWATAPTRCSQVSSTSSTSRGRQRLGDRRHRIVARLDRQCGGGGNRRGGADEGRVVNFGLKST